MVFLMRLTARRCRDIRSLVYVRTYLYRYMTVMPKQAIERPNSDVPPFIPTYVKLQSKLCINANALLVRRRTRT